MRTIVPDLLARARAGDDQARDELLKLLLADMRPMARKYARCMGVETDDLLQEVALELWRSWQRVMETVNPIPYVCRLARNTLVDEYRKACALKRCPVAGLVPLDKLEGWAL